MEDTIKSGIGDVCVIVPTLNPDQNFLSVIQLLIDKGFKVILIVDDGSKPGSEVFFDQAARHPECIILRHYRNLGKGRAIKTAFNYYLIHYPEMKGTVTVDADNQHHIDDIVRCAEYLVNHQDSLILGVRDFHSPNVPKRNRMGNLITIWVFSTLCGIKVSDTQTGLRAMSNQVVSEFLDIDGERFEYETNMLIETKKRMIPIEEVTIRTVYSEGKQSSHFNPFRDSVRIYLLILKFLSASIVSFLVDLTVFTVLMSMLASLGLETRIAIATVSARVLSSLINYLVNRNFVFQTGRSASNTFKKYYCLAVIQMLFSMGGVYALTILLGIHSTVIKVVVDFILFFLSFQVQREWVFAKNNQVRTQGKAK